ALASASVVAPVAAQPTGTPKAGAPKADAPKADAPKADAPKADAPKPDAPKPDAPKPDAPKPDAPKPDAPKPDAPKPDAPKADAPSTATVEDARSRMEKGQRLFADEKYSEAGDEFASAYDKHRFDAFLYNAAVAYEKAGKRDQAVGFYKRFLEAEPTAPDKKAIEETIERLKKEEAAPPAEMTASTKKADIKSLVFVESEPAGAPLAIFERVSDSAPTFDPKDSVHPGYREVIGSLQTPTNLSLAQGTYFLLVKGFADYNANGSLFTFENGRVYVYRAGLSQGDFVGRVEVAMPISTGKVYVDDPPPHKNAPRSTGPSSFELSPGKHKVWVDAAGFRPFEKEIDIAQGKTARLDAKLERLDYGYVLVKGDAEEVTVEVDGEDAGVYKLKGDPLRIRLPAGDHEFEIDADGRKAYESFISVPRGQEIGVDAKLEEAPGKGGAVVTALLAAGSLAGGIVAYVKSESLAEGEDLKDPLKYVGIGCLAGAGALTGLAVFLFVYDPTDDSTAKVLPPREFTGETPGPDKKTSQGIRVRLDANVGPAWSTGAASPALGGAVFGLSATGRF
ncbi:MAG TPA: hypothetical protein VL400_13190, partial [Polyangiaceae bacterium]|nr:hypothetical protein [Polyangiaceae bacterium]